MFNIRYRGLRDDPAHFEPERLAGHALKRCRVARGGPEFQLRVARRPQLQQVVVSAVVKLDAVDDLRVTAIQAFGEPQDRRERADRAPRPAPEIAEAVVTALGR